MTTPLTPRERLDELLAMQAIEGLTAPETQELERLLREHPDVDPAQYSDAAAAAFLASPAAREPMPAQLRDAIAKTIPAHARTGGDGRAVVGAIGPARGGASWLPWLAAAAGIVLAAWAWWPRLATQPAPSPAEQIKQTLAAAPDVTRIPWQRQADATATNMTGEVVWSQSLKKGYLRFTGLAVNDRSKEQYQLWIFDKNLPDARYPIDGGVFDNPAGVAELIVPIDARIPVTEPAAFAVTVERAGGVVVTTKERLVALAPVTF